MHYQVSRAGQMYGPYTIEDIQRYVGLGNILPSDLAKSEEMPEWIPVAQLLGSAVPPPVADAPVYPAAYPVYGAPVAYPASALSYPDPPNLHWLLVMLLSMVTCGIFTVVWNLMLSAWVRRVLPTSKVLTLYITCYVIGLVSTTASIANSAPNLIHLMHHEPIVPNNLLLSSLISIVGLAAWVVRLVARFTLRDGLVRHFNTAEPLGLRLSGVMTFFFGNLYFTYHINRLMEIKQAMRYRQPQV